MNSFTAFQQKVLPKDAEIALSWTGQAGFSFKDSRGFVYHIDPYLSNICSQYSGYHRMISAPVGSDQIKGNYFIFTHEHRDHLDTDSIPIIAESNPDSIFVGPPACISRLLELNISPHRLVTIKRNDSIDFGNMNIKAVLAVHTDDSVGYVLSFGDIKVYITGDTVYTDELIKVADDHPDLMISCINGRLGCMNIADAVRLTSHIQPKIAIPMHIHMFLENSANPGEYIRQVELHSSITKGYMMEHGEWYVYTPADGLRKVKAEEYA
jgi:L-ascorbate metabolism protein UlaG (beta-lactamase superfamily)